MIEFGKVLSAVIPVFLIVGAGFPLRRLRWLTAEADQSLLRLTIHLLMPCLILDAALGNPALRQWGNLVLAPLVGIGTVILGFVCARGFHRAAGLQTPAERRTFTVTTGLYRCGFVSGCTGSGCKALRVAPKFQVQARVFVIDPWARRWYNAGEIRSRERNTRPCWSTLEAKRGNRTKSRLEGLESQRGGRETNVGYR